MKFSNCDIKATCDSGKIKLKKPNDRELIATTTCKCGTEVVQVRFSDGIDKYILEQLGIARYEAEQKGRSVFYAPLNEVKSLNGQCGRCGRLVIGSVDFRIDPKLLRSFDKLHTEGEAEGIYGGLLKIEAKVKKGWFSEFAKSRDPRALIRPTCSCARQLISNEGRKALERMIQAINDVFNVEDAEDPEPIKLTEKMKCPYCMSKVKLELKLTPMLPKNDGISVYIRAFHQWSERYQD